MDFGLNDDQLSYQAECRRFAEEVIRPAAPLHDREESVPWEVIKEARRQGFGGLEGMQRAAEDPEGQMQPIMAEQFHWGCAGIALAISGSGLAAAGVASSGTPEQIMRWVPECFGDAETVKLGAYAVTEPQAGSDVKSLKTTARRDGDEWVLNGTKVFITNGGIADVTVVVATVDPTLGTRGQASFVVQKGTPGLSQGKKESKLGIRASQTTEVVLEECRIPGDQLLGGDEKLERKLERGRSGQKSRAGADALATFEVTRPIVGASALGIAQAAYEWTLEYLYGREEGGVPMLSAQRVQQTLADVATEIESARLLVQRASWMGRNGQADDRRPGLDVEAEGGRRDDVGDDDPDGPRRPGRLEHRPPAREVVPRRQDLPAVRGHGRDPAHGHLPHAVPRVRRAPRLRRRGRRPGPGRPGQRARPRLSFRHPAVDGPKSRYRRVFGPST